MYGLILFCRLPNKVNQIVAMEMLRKFGANVITANNGHEAVVRVSSGEMFDLVLMDIQMPVLNGFEATAAIRRVKSELELPIIAMTALAFNEERDKCLAAGMNDHLPKPIFPDNLYAVLLRWLSPGKTLSTSAPVELPAEALPDTLPGINVAAALSRLNGNSSLLQKILIEFRDTNKTTISDIREAMEARDRDKTLQILHTLKGVAGSICAASLAKTAVKCETAVRHDNEAAMPDLFHTLERQLAELFASIELLEGTGARTAVTVNSEETGSVDLDALAAELRELYGQLGQNRVSAVKLFRQLKSRLPATKERTSLEKQVDSFNFNGAQTKLAHLAKTMGIELSGKGKL